MLHFGIHQNLFRNRNRNYCNEIQKKSEIGIMKSGVSRSIGRSEHLLNECEAVTISADFRLLDKVDKEGSSKLDRGAGDFPLPFSLRNHDSA